MKYYARDKQVVRILMEVQRLCLRNPDFVYEAREDKCEYFNGANACGCIFGQALQNLGYDFKNIVMGHSGKERSIKILWLLGEMDIVPSQISGEVLKPFTMSELQVLNSLQQWQDHKTPWGECWQHAKEYFKSDLQEYLDFCSNFRFTGEELVAKVRELGISNYGYLYEKVTPPEEFQRKLVNVCLYSYGKDGWGCGCIIGKALQRLGVSLEALKALDSIGNTEDGWSWTERFGYACPRTSAVIDVLRSFTTVDAKSADWLSVVQNSQDRGATWGEAVERADSPDPESD